MPPTAPRRAALTAIALLVLCALLVRDVSRPPNPVPASAPATEFSAERAMAHVREIAQRPHPTGSPDNARVREYLAAQLRALGLEPEVWEAMGVGTRYAEAGRVQNVIARLPGRTPGGLSVVLMSHYDGVAGGPAAGDDGAGTAAILETVRALRAGPPLAHDVIVLITDGEEAGLLGAAAFVREHPWAKDVGVTLNFEARGTTGRSYMFETGPGNLDVVRVLRRVPGVSATSLSVTVYRSMPNDTDLSEIAVLGRPALNFAFADGVERYHTAYDDVAHLTPGSLQHHGTQMLALAREFGDGPLPRPATPDAVFFDLPLVGLIVYPESWALPTALVALALVVGAIVLLVRRRQPWGRDVILGMLGAIVAPAIGGGAALVAGNAIVRMHDAMGWGGAPAFRGIYTAALGVLALAVSLACWAFVRRWASVRGAHVGALVVWGIVTLLVSWKLPGVSFMFVWPVMTAAIAAVMTVRTPANAARRMTSSAGAEVALWVATIVGAAVLVPIAYTTSAVLLGAAGPGGVTAGVLVALLAWLLAPQLEALGAGRRWTVAAATLVIAAALAAVGMATIRSSPDHPTPSIIAYALDADSANAWLVARGPTADALVATTTPDERAPAWLTRAYGTGRSAAYAPAPRVQIEPPTAAIISDSVLDTGRRVVLRVRAAAGTGTVDVRATGTRVLAASVDGRLIDPSRYRTRVRLWRLTYSAPSDTGFTLDLTVPPGNPVSLELTARSRGIPSLPGVRLPSRAPDVVTIQSGDVTIARRVARFE